MTTTDDLITEGRHAALCRSIQFGRTEGGKEQIAIGFELFGDGDPDAGRFVTYFGGFAEASNGKKHGPIDFTVQALRNIGWVGDDLSELPALAESGELNHEVWLVIAHEEFDGKLSARVKWVNKPGGGAVQLKKPMDAREVSTFAAAMRSRLRADAPRKPAAPPANSGGRRTQHPNAPGSSMDDDLPF